MKVRARRSDPLREGGGIMSKNNRAFALRCVAAAALVIAAVFCRGVARGAGSEFLARFLNFVSIFVYAGMLTAWGMSVNRRAVQTQARRLLVTAAAACVGIIAVPEVVSLYVTSAEVQRYTYYLTVAFMTIIPTFALLISFCVGKADDYRLPKSAWLFFVPALLLSAAVLTNDLHGLAFSELELNNVWVAESTRYGLFFYTAMGWAAVCLIAALVITLVKCGTERNGKYLWLPLPIAISAVYVVLYAVGVSFLRGFADDPAILLCLAFAAFFESCIHGGVIRSNADYGELLQASKGISVRLVDVNNEELIASADAEPMSKETILAAIEKPVTASGGKVLYSAPVGGGYALWTEAAHAPETIEEGGADR